MKGKLRKRDIGTKGKERMHGEKCYEKGERWEY